MEYTACPDDSVSETKDKHAQRRRATLAARTANSFDPQRRSKGREVLQQWSEIRSELRYRVSLDQKLVAMSGIDTTPVPMEAHGGYNRSSSVQASGSSPALPLFERAAATVPLSSSSEAIVIADYGSSQGHNSLAPLAAAIRVLRARIGAERAISVVHTDLPANDFSALFQTLESDPGSYLRGDAAVFPSAVGRSFYQQILPSSSVNLGWSSWSVQWLSCVPGPIPDQVQVAYSRDAAARGSVCQTGRGGLAELPHETRG